MPISEKLLSVGKLLNGETDTLVEDDEKKKKGKVSQRLLDVGKRIQHFENYGKTDKTIEPKQGEVADVETVTDTIGKTQPKQETVEPNKFPLIFPEKSANRTPKIIEPVQPGDPNNVLGSLLTKQQKPDEYEKFRTVSLPGGKVVLPDKSQKPSLVNAKGEVDPTATKQYEEQLASQKPKDYTKLKDFQKDLDKIEYLDKKYVEGTKISSPEEIAKDERELQNLINKRNTAVGIHNNLTYGELEDAKLFRAYQKIQSLKGRSDFEKDLSNAPQHIYNGVLGAINVTLGSDFEGIAKSDIRKDLTNLTINENFKKETQPKTLFGSVVQGLTTTAALAPLFALGFSAGGVKQGAGYLKNLWAATKGSGITFAPGGVSRGLDLSIKEVAEKEKNGEKLDAMDRAWIFTKHIGGETLKNTMEGVSEMMIPGFKPGKTFLANVLKKSTLGIATETGTEQISDITGDLVDGTNTSLLVSFARDGKFSEESINQFLTEAIIAALYGSTVGGGEFWFGHLDSQLPPEQAKKLKKYVEDNKETLEKNLGKVVNKTNDDAGLTFDQYVRDLQNPDKVKNSPKDYYKQTEQEPLFPPTADMEKSTINIAPGGLDMGQLTDLTPQERQRNGLPQTDSFDTDLQLINALAQKKANGITDLTDQEKIIQEIYPAQIDDLTKRITQTPEFKEQQSLQRQRQKQVTKIDTDRLAELTRQAKNAQRKRSLYNVDQLKQNIDQLQTPEIKEKAQGLLDEVTKHNEKLQSRNTFTLENLADRKYGKRNLNELDEEQQKAVLNEYNEMKKQGIAEFKPISVENSVLKGVTYPEEIKPAQIVPRKTVADIEKEKKAEANKPKDLTKEGFTLEKTFEDNKKRYVKETPEGTHRVTMRESGEVVNDRVTSTYLVEKSYLAEDENGEVGSKEVNIERNNLSGKTTAYTVDAETGMRAVEEDITKRLESGKTIEEVLSDTFGDVAGYNQYNQANKFQSNVKRIKTKTVKDHVAEGKISKESQVAEEDINLNPTDAQKEAGNYKKAHIKKEGLDISIENPKGSIRSGKDQDGETWETEMNNDYGYIKNTVGKDKDHLDVFLASDYQEDAPVFIVNQTTPDGKFDEHKILLGFTNMEEAEGAYKANYNEGAAHYDDIVEMPMDRFKKWSKNEQLTKKPAKGEEGFLEKFEKLPKEKQIKIKMEYEAEWENATDKNALNKKYEEIVDKELEGKDEFLQSQIDRALELINSGEYEKAIDKYPAIFQFARNNEYYSIPFSEQTGFTLPNEATTKAEKKALIDKLKQHFEKQKTSDLTKAKEGTLAVKLTSGEIIYDEEALKPADILENQGIEALDIVEFGTIKGGKFVPDLAKPDNNETAVARMITEGKTVKQIATALNLSIGEAGKLAIKIAGKNIPEKDRPIGVNKNGDYLYEDKNGVRSRLEGRVKLTEPVGLIPTKNGIVKSVERKDEEWLTTEELKGKNKEDEPSELKPQKTGYRGGDVGGWTSLKKIKQTEVDERGNQWFDDSKYDLENTEAIFVTHDPKDALYYELPAEFKNLQDVDLDNPTPDEQDIIDEIKENDPDEWENYLKALENPEEYVVKFDLEGAKPVMTDGEGGYLYVRPRPQGTKDQGGKKSLMEKIELDDRIERIREKAYKAESVDDLSASLTTRDVEDLAEAGLVKQSNGFPNKEDLEYFYDRNKKPDAEETPEETENETDAKGYPKIIDEWGSEHTIKLWATHLTKSPSSDPNTFRLGGLGWEWWGFRKQGDIWDGYVEGFENEFGSFSESELKENQVKIETDPKELQRLSPPIGWKWKMKKAKKKPSKEPAAKPKGDKYIAGREDYQQLEKRAKELILEGISSNTKGILRSAIENNDLGTLQEFVPKAEAELKKPEEKPIQTTGIIDDDMKNIIKDIEKGLEGITFQLKKPIDFKKDIGFKTVTSKKKPTFQLKPGEKIPSDVQTKANELIGKFVDKGITKFDDVIKTVNQAFGEETLKRIFPALKAGYTAYLTNATDEETEKMDSFDYVKKYTLEKQEEKKPEKSELEVKDNTKVIAGYKIPDYYITGTADINKEDLKELGVDPVFWDMLLENPDEITILYKGEQISQEEVKVGDVIIKAFNFLDNAERPDVTLVKKIIPGKEISGDMLSFSGAGHVIPFSKTFENVPQFIRLKKQEGEPKDTGHIEVSRPFIQRIREEIRAGNVLNKTQLEKIAREFGITDQNVAKEQAELAIVAEARKIINETPDEKEAYDKLVKMYEKQPNLTHRTNESIEKQQYSTPAPVAFATGLFVSDGVRAGDVLEPSAGNGMLTIAFNTGQVYVNEIDQVRLANLRQSGFQDIKELDAEKNDNLFNKKFDGIMTNPPFGGTESKDFDGYTFGKLEQIMAANALKQMKSDGRAGIIIGGHNRYDNKGRLKNDRTFFNWLNHFYNVEGVLNVSGELYRRQGAAFPIRVILINGRKAVPQGASPLFNEVSDAEIKSFEELYNRIEEIRNGNILQPGNDGNRGQSGITDVPNTQGQGDQEAGGIKTISETTDSGTNPEKPTKPGQTPNVSVRPAGAGKPISGKPNTTGGSDTGKPSLQGSVSSGKTGKPGGIVEGGSGGDVQQGFDRGTSPVAPRAVLDSNKANLSYVPESKGTSLDTVIPRNMAFDTAKTLKKLAESVGGDIDAFVAEKLGYEDKEELFSHLGAEQIDAVAMAIVAIEKGQGMIVGDMTGVGKGRIAASIIRYGILNGYEPIFFSETADLYSDLYRDLVDIGSGELNPFIVNEDAKIVDEDGKVLHQSPKGKKKIDVLQSGELGGYDFVLCTYSQVRDEKRKLKRNFIDGLAQGNILIMDESHNASGNSNTGVYFRQIVQASKGVTYLSATFAKRPDNMPIYALKTAIREANLSEEELVRAIERGGVALQEILSTDMVEAGQMIRRERTYEGIKVTYKPLTEKKKEHTKIVDAVTGIVRDIINFQRDHISGIVDRLDTVASETGETVTIEQGTNMAGVDNTPFASKVFNVVDQLLFSIKADSIADETIEAFKRGQKPVIAVKNTMESFLDYLGATPGEVIENTDFSTVLERGLRGVFRIRERDAMGNVTQSEITLNQLSEEGRKAYRALIDKINTTTTGITISPIDQIIYRLNKAGYKVGEVTGRDITLKFRDDGKAIVEKRTEKDKKKLFRDFNNWENPGEARGVEGHKDMALMINASGSTGRSAHSSPKFKDQRQRIMITGQIELNINTEIQKRGRINRTGQVNKPEYITLSSAIPAEQRLMMMAKKKLKSLDANVSSDQSQAGTTFEANDFLNKYGDAIVVGFLKENRDINDLLLDPLKMDPMTEEQYEKFDTWENAAHKVSGRVAILPTALQEEFYKEMGHRYDDQIAYLESVGENDLEVKTLPLDAVTTSSRMLVAGKGGESPFGRDTIVETAEINVLKKPYRMEKVNELIDTYLEGSTKGDKKKTIQEEFKIFWEEWTKTHLDKKKESVAKALEISIEDVNSNLAGKLTVEDIAKKYAHFAKYGASGPLRVQMEFDKYYTESGKLSGQADHVLNNLLGRYNIGRAYKVPLIRDVVSPSYSNGIFLGWKINKSRKNPYAPSAIVMRFAVTDSRQVVEIVGSNRDWLNDLMSESASLEAWQEKDIIAGWDNSLPDSRREVKQIVTGNILQAMGGDVKGQLISYTTKDGGLKRGILIRDNKSINTDEVRVPIKRALKFIKNLDFGDFIETASGDVVISNYNGRTWRIEVPASKQKGGKYYLDEAIRRVVKDGRFDKAGNQMRADFDRSKLEELINILQDDFGQSVRLSQDQLKQIEDTDNSYQLKPAKVYQDDFNNNIPARFSNIHEFKLKHPSLKNVKVEFIDPKIVYWTREEIEATGYTPELLNLEKLEEGDFGYEQGKEKYAVEVTGYNRDNPKQAGSTITISSRATTSAYTEEIIHTIYNGLEKENPQLLQKIQEWERIVREEAEAFGIEIPQGVETFAQVMTFTHLGYAEEQPNVADVFELPADILDEFTQILNKGEISSDVLKGNTQRGAIRLPSGKTDNSLKNFQRKRQEKQKFTQADPKIAKAQEIYKRLKSEKGETKDVYPEWVREMRAEYGKDFDKEARSIWKKRGEVFYQLQSPRREVIEYLGTPPKDLIESAVLRSYNQFDHKLPIKEEIVDAITRNDTWTRSTQSEEIQRVLKSFDKEVGGVSLKLNPEMKQARTYLKEKLNEAVKKGNKDGNLLPDYRRNVKGEKIGSDVSVPTQYQLKPGKKSDNLSASQILTNGQGRFPTPVAIKEAKELLKDNFLEEYYKFRDKRKVGDDYQDVDRVAEEGYLFEDFARRVVAANKMGVQDINTDLYSKAMKFDKIDNPNIYKSVAFQLRKPKKTREERFHGYKYESELAREQDREPENGEGNVVDFGAGLGNVIFVTADKIHEFIRNNQLEKRFNIEGDAKAKKLYRELLTAPQWFFDKEPQLKRIWDIMDRYFVRNVNEETAILKEDKWRNSKPWKKLSDLQKKEFLSALEEYEYMQYELQRDEGTTDLLDWADFADEYNLTPEVADFLFRVYKPTIETALDMVKDVDRYKIINETETNPYLQAYFEAVASKKLTPAQLQLKLEEAKDEFFNDDPNAQALFENELLRMQTPDEVKAMQLAWANNPNLRTTLAEVLIDKKYEAIDGKAYFPSSRLDRKYFLSALKKTTPEQKLLLGLFDDKYFTTSNSLLSLDRIKTDLEAQGYTVKVGKFAEAQEEILMNAVSQEDIIDLALSAGVAQDNPILEKLVKAIQAKGFSRHFIPKRFIPGFEYNTENFEEAIFKYITAVPFYKNRTIGGKEFAKTIARLKHTGVLKPGSANDRYVQDLKNKLENRDISLSNALRAIASTYYLALSPAYLSQQIVQPFNTLLPYLPIVAKELGLRSIEAEKAFGEALFTSLQYWGWKVIDKANRVLGRNTRVTFGLDRDFLSIIRSLERQGVGKPLRSMELAGQEVDPRKHYNRDIAEKTFDVLGWIAKIAGSPGIMIEDFTRTIGIRAFYNLGKKAGLRGEALEDFISSSIAKSYGPASGRLAKPPGYYIAGEGRTKPVKQLAQSTIESWLTFKNFAFMNYGQWGKIWRSLRNDNIYRSAAYKLGSQIGLGGLKYMMWSSSILTLMSLIYGMLDIPDDPEEQYEDMFKELNKVAPGLGDALYKGIASITFKVDLSSLFSQTAPLEEPFTKDAIELIGGAPASAIKDIATGRAPRFLRGEQVTKKWKEEGIKLGSRKLIPTEKEYEKQLREYSRGERKEKPESPVTEDEITKRKLGYTSLRISDAYADENSRQFKSGQYTDIIRDKVTDEIIPLIESGKSKEARDRFRKIWDDMKEDNILTEHQKKSITGLNNFISQVVLSRLKEVERQIIKDWKNGSTNSRTRSENRENSRERDNDR